MNEPAADPQNQILDRYNEWKFRTPFVTRTILLTLSLVYLLSWLLPFSDYLTNIPFFTVYKLELYRILLAPLVCESLMSLIFVFMSMGNLANTMEHSMGSAGFLMLCFGISTATHVSFTAGSLILYYVFADPGAMFYQVQGFWGVLMGLITIESQFSSMPTRRLLFLPFQIPTPYYPIALLAFFTLFMGIKMDMVISVAVGYSYANDKLPFLRVRKETLVSWEADGGLLQNFSRREGWVGASGAAGFDNLSNAFLPTTSGNNNGSAPAPARAAAGGGSAVGGGGLGRGPGVVKEPTFPGGGNTLGADTYATPPAGGWDSTTRGDDSDAERREAQRRAAERRNRDVV